MSVISYSSHFSTLYCTSVFKALLPYRIPTVIFAVLGHRNTPCVFNMNRFKGRCGSKNTVLCDWTRSVIGNLNIGFREFSSGIYCKWNTNIRFAIFFFYRKSFRLTEMSCIILYNYTGWFIVDEASEIYQDGVDVQHGLQLTFCLTHKSLKSHFNGTPCMFTLFGY